jgi:hypothetical protein
MAFNAKVLGNVLANRSRGLSSDASKQISPGNMPIKDPLTEGDMPDIAPDANASFDVPAAALQGVVEGDVLTVGAIVGDTVTLTKQAGAEAPTEPIAPPIP